MSTLTIDKSQAKERFVSRFIRAYANGRNLCAEVKQQAIAALDTLQIPTTKSEEWKYTRLNSLTGHAYEFPVGPEDYSNKLPALEGLEADRLVFINGRYAPDLSDTGKNGELIQIATFKSVEGVLATVLERYYGTLVPADKDIFSAINTAYAEDGVLIYIPQNAIAKAPIHIVHLVDTPTQHSAMLYRNLFVVEKNAQVQILESLHTLSVPVAGSTFRNHVNEIWVEESANLEYVKLQLESPVGNMVDTTAVQLAQSCKASVFTITLGGGLVRNNLRMRLEGSDVEAHLIGLSHLDGVQHVDNFTQVEHVGPNSFSNELYKGIIDEKATGVFNGRIHVLRGAQKTNAYQSNRNILLTDTSNIYTKPQLEIYADDVKCSHGATTGRMDEEALFYLRARGVKLDDARKMLLHAFAGDVIEQIGMDVVKDYVMDLIDAKFENQHVTDHLIP